MRILMAVDGSKQAAQATVAAARLLLTQGAGVDLLCAVPQTDDHSHRHSLEKRANRVLNAAREQLLAVGVPAESIVRTGSAASVLLAASKDYDVIAISAASHGDGASGMGPVTSRIVEHSNTSALVIRDGVSTAGLRVLVPVDGSDASLNMVERLAALADLSEANVTLLHVVETPWLHAGLDQEWEGLQEPEEAKIDPQTQWGAEFEREASEILAEARRRLPQSVAVTVLVARGLPANEILAEAAQGDYDLIAVGTSGARDLKHDILGSVSAKVVWNAECSVLVVRG